MPLAHSGVGANTTAATATDTAAAASYPGAEYGAKIREEMSRLTCKENWRIRIDVNHTNYTKYNRIQA